MKKEIILAGFGGQGILTMGVFLANAGLSEGRQVSCVPAYGAEMRGGTANCTVIISDQPISSPVVTHPEIAVVMNRPSLEKFEPLVKPGGLLLVNQSLANRPVNRTDLTSYIIPAQDLANEAGMANGCNMIMMGVLLKLTEVINLDNIYEYLVITFKGKYLEKMPLNVTTIERGIEYARQLQAEKIIDIA